MYDIYYDRRGDSDLHEIFIGSQMELHDHISDLLMLGCYNIEFYKVKEVTQ